MVLTRVFLFAAGAGLIVPFPALSQAYPVKPIQVLSTTSVGSPGDVALRMIASKIAESLGQPIVIEPRLGGAGIIAGGSVSRAAPDGYTLIYSPSGGFVMSRFLVKNLPFDALNDFTPISLAVTAPNYIAVHASVPVNSLKELIDYAKRNPGKLEYGTTGIGGSQHMIMESFRLFTGIDILHIPYAQKNQPQLVNDTVTGRLPLSITSYSMVAPHVPSGKIKFLAVVDNARSKLLPAVPSTKELLPNYHNIVTWWSFFGPPGLSPSIVSRVSTEIRNALRDAAATTKLQDLGLSIVGSTPEELASTLKSDIESVAKLVRALGLKPQ